MTLYRALQAIARGDTRIPIGTVHSFDWLDADTLTLLLERDVLARVSAPPLAVIPAWRERAKRLEKLGIRTPEDVLDASPALIRRALRLSVAGSNELRADALALLSASGD